MIVLRRLRAWPLLAGLLYLAAPVRAAEPAPGPLAHAVVSVGMTVSDMDRALEFYTGVLPFTKVSDVEVAGDELEHLEGVFGARVRIVTLKLGGESIELTEYLAPRGRPIPPDMRSNDRAFQHIAMIVSDMDKAYTLLRAHRVEHASTGPQRLPDWNKAAGGIKAFYFKDPDHHVLEVLQFPPDKGPAKWHATDRLFLGIDHTAIVVSDTEGSLRFYRDLLGMTIAGEADNYGTEQEHLNNVFGAHLRITAVRAAEGPGVEFLEYLAPRDGRPAPEDLRANDLLQWQTTIATGAEGAAWPALLKGHVPLVSPGMVGVPADSFGFHKGVVVRDPDRHAIRIVER